MPYYMSIFAFVIGMVLALSLLLSYPKKVSNLILSIRISYRLPSRMLASLLTLADERNYSSKGALVGSLNTTSAQPTHGPPPTYPLLPMAYGGNIECSLCGMNTLYGNASGPFPTDQPSDLSLIAQKVGASVIPSMDEAGITQLRLSRHGDFTAITSVYWEDGRYTHVQMIDRSTSSHPSTSTDAN